MNSYFEFPPIDGNSDLPKWNGVCFIVDGKELPLLEYSENFHGWSDDLTFLHEDAVGEAHPIDVMSRALAIENIQLTFKNKATRTMLEIGCSSGYFLQALLKNFPGAEVIGADVVKQPLYDLAKKNLGIPLLRFDLLKCPLPHKCVDVLIMLNVLEHIDDDQEALNKAFNLIKPGGIFYIEVPAGKYLYDNYDEELKHFRRYSSKDLCNKLENAGFTISKKTHIGFIIFPLFSFIKLKNKFLGNKKNNSQNYVFNAASKTSKSHFLKILFYLEFKFFSKFQLPFGIRTAVVAIRN